MKYYVYVDWTLEETPRPFYVGKGSGGRFLRQRRNWKHRQVRNELGLNRMTVFETDNEEAALQREIDLIAYHHTFVSDVNYNGIGSNFTGGGEGGSHPSENTRKLIAESNVRRRGEKRSVAAKNHIRVAIQASVIRRGTWTLSEKHKNQIAKALKGHTVSESTRKKLSEVTKRMHQDPVVKRKIVQALRLSIAVRVLEIDPMTNDVIQEHPTMNQAAKSAGLTVKYLRQALRLNDQEYLMKRTGRKWQRIG